MEQNLKEDDRLLRRAFFKDPSYVREDMTVTSFAFKLRKKKETGLSVDIERLTTYEKSIQDPKRFRLFALKVRKVNELGLNTVYCPIENNPAHAEIRGNLSNSICSQLAKAAVYVPYPY